MADNCNTTQSPRPATSQRNSSKAAPRPTTQSRVGPSASPPEGRTRSHAQSRQPKDHGDTHAPRHARMHHHPRAPGRPSASPPEGQARRLSCNGVSHTRLWPTTPMPSRPSASPPEGRPRLKSSVNIYIVNGQTRQRPTSKSARPDLGERERDLRV